MAEYFGVRHLSPACAYYVTEFLMRGKLQFGFYFLHVILPEVIYTGVVGILIYRLIVVFENLLSFKRKEE